MYFNIRHTHRMYEFISNGKEEEKDIHREDQQIFPKHEKLYLCCKGFI